jgi:hypothetical protein
MTKARRFSKMFWGAIMETDETLVVYVYRKSDRAKIYNDQPVPGCWMTLDDKNLLWSSFDQLIEQYCEEFLTNPWERGTNGL